MKEKLKVRVGQFWKRRDGRIVRIDAISKLPNDDYFLLINDYTTRDSFGLDLTEVTHDLIEPIISIYAAGPMSGYPDNNYPAFNEESAILRNQGFHVENPAQNPDPHDKCWNGYMRTAIRQLIECDRIHLLENWSKSRGALVEYKLAKGLGLEITFQNGQAASEEINVK